MPLTTQRSFTSGSISPAVQARADLSKYATGLNVCENFFVRAQGGVYSRPGLRFIGPLDDQTQRARLIPFSFNTQQTYILVFEHLKVRVIRDGGFVLDGAGPALFELATPYTAAELYDLGYTQSADIMTIVHPDHDPAELSRLDHDDWTLTDVDYSPQIVSPVISSSVAVGTGAGDFDKTYRYVVSTIDESGVESLPSAESSITTASLSVTAGVRITWPTAISGADFYRVYKDPSDNSGIYGWIGDSKTGTFDDFNIAPITSDAPLQDRQPFVGAGNKPSTVNYYQQRIVFANTENEPQTVYTSQTGTFNSMRTSSPARDDDALTFTVVSQQVNEVRHILSLDALILLTSGGEWIVSEGQDQVLTPSTIGVRAQSYNGAAKVKPVIINSTALYVQNKAARIRDLAYEFSGDKYTGNDLSLMSEHLFEGYSITDMAYAAEPYSIVWCLRNDGVLLGLTYQREHQVWGWHSHTTDGDFESIAVVSEGNRDAVYVIVRRDVDGNEVRYVERLEARESIDPVQAFYVDSGLTYDGAPATAISGLDHLEGKSVALLADGYTLPNQTVVSGAVTLANAASVVHVGLPYVPVIETLDLDTGATTETLKPMSLSVSKVTLELEGTRGGFVGPRLDNGSTGQMLEIKPRFDVDGYDPVALKTYKASIYIDPQWSRTGGIRIEQRAPLPMSILSISPQVDIGGI